MTAEEWGRGVTRRRLLQGAGAVLGVGALTVLVGRELYGPPPGGPWDPATLTGPVFGMLQAEPDVYPDLDAAGVGAVTLSVPWSRAQPRPGDLDEDFLRRIDEVQRVARGSGLELALSPGLQYPPGWVEDLPGARFVDQHGRTWRGPAGDDVVDAVFNPEVREAQGEYLRLLAEHASEWRVAGVRIGGLARGELHYPPVDRSAVRNTYWAYGVAARAQCPVPWYRPGEGSREDAAVFLAWYLGALREYGRWQMTTARELFGDGPRLLVLMPSWGIRPGEVEVAVAAGLDGTTTGERRGTLTEGLAWEQQVLDAAAVPGADVCTTWLDAEDQGNSLGDIGPGRYLAGLAGRHGLGVWGENTGGNDTGDLRRCVRLVQELGLQGLFWMGAEDLGEDGNASLQDYAVQIRALRRQD
ncbi:hypothetical protein ACI8AC_11470 [Geodermatophilus sp. SYSU D00758]